MKRALLLIALAMLITGAAAARPSTALACSASEDFDPLEGLDLVVTGRATDVSLVGKSDLSNFIVVDVAFEVDRYLLGTGPTAIVLTDERSAMPPPGVVRSDSDFRALDLATLSPDELGWAGASGSCGALDSDPRGQYWLVGAKRTETGQLTIHRFSLFAVGAEPDDARVTKRLEWIEGLISDAGPAPAETGTAGIATSSTRSTPDALAFLLMGLGATVIVGARARVRHR